MAKRRKPLGSGLTSVIGGALVEFEQQIFRSRPRQEQRYLHRDETTVTSAEGGTMTIGLPGDEPPGGDVRPAGDESPPAPASVPD